MQRLLFEFGVLSALFENEWLEKNNPDTYAWLVGNAKTCVVMSRKINLLTKMMKLFEKFGKVLDDEAQGERLCSW